MAPGGNTRRYLAESVAAVIEVKSNISVQWQDALRTAKQLAPLRRRFGAAMTMGLGPTDNIPLFVAGYTGWRTLPTLEQNLAKNPEVAGILVIDKGLFVSSAQFGDVLATGPWSLWGLIICLHQITNGLQAASTDPSAYAV